MSGIYDIKGFIQHMHTLMLSLMVVYFTDYVENINGVDIKSKLVCAMLQCTRKLHLWMTLHP
jgi:hypothetical protein